MIVGQKTVKIGTRGSKLAIIQANLAVQYIEQFTSDFNFEIITITTSGDKITDKPLHEIGGKALFTKELEYALINEEIDLAVHSAKDIEHDYPNALHFPCVLPEVDSEDVMILRDGLIPDLNCMPHKLIIGTSSTRRQKQIRHLLKHTIIEFQNIRGNVETRINFLKNTNLDAVILAKAGLKRLNINDLNAIILSKDQMMPAIGQGIIAIQSKIDSKLNYFLQKISDRNTKIKFDIYRHFVETLKSSCFTPLGGDIQIKNQIIETCFIMVDNNNNIIREIMQSTTVESFQMLGINMAKKFLPFMNGNLIE